MMGRKLTDQQKARRATTVENNRRKKEAPLLVATGALPLTTEEEQRQRLQLAVARALDRPVGTPHYDALHWLHERRLARMVRERVGPELFAQLEAHSRRVYPSVTYYADYWRKVLTGDRVVFAWKLCFDPARINRWNNDGRYLVEDGVFQANPPFLTPEEFEQMFPPDRWDRPPEQLDDGGVMDRLQQAIARSKGGAA